MGGLPPPDAPLSQEQYLFESMEYRNYRIIIRRTIKNWRNFWIDGHSNDLQECLDWVKFELSEEILIFWHPNELKSYRTFEHFYDLPNIFPSICDQFEVHLRSILRNCFNEFFFVRPILQISLDIHFTNEFFCLLTIVLL